MNRRLLIGLAAALLCACAGTPPEPPVLAQDAPSGATGTACSIRCGEQTYSRQCPRNAAPVCQCASKPYAYCMLASGAP
jgi:hypothetical protein